MILLFNIKSRTLGFAFCQPPKKSLPKSLTQKKSLQNFNPRKSPQIANFKPKKRASHIPVTYIPQYPSELTTQANTLFITNLQHKPTFFGYQQQDKLTKKIHCFAISNLQHKPILFGHGYQQFTTQANTLWLSATTQADKKYTVLLSAIYNTKMHTVLLSPIYNTSQQSLAISNLQYKPTLLLTPIFTTSQ